VRVDDEQQIIRATALTLTDTHVTGLAGLTEWIEEHLDGVYGISHPRPLSWLLPAIKATHHALIGTPDDTQPVDPITRRQLRHTLTQDGSVEDTRWDLGSA